MADERPFNNEPPNPATDSPVVAAEAFELVPPPAQPAASRRSSRSWGCSRSSSSYRGHKWGWRNAGGWIWSAGLLVLNSNCINRLTQLEVGNCIAMCSAGFC